MSFADIAGKGWSYVGLILALLATGSVIYKNKVGKWPWEKK
jgi:hypothetical protein